MRAASPQKKQGNYIRRDNNTGERNGRAKKTRERGPGEKEGGTEEEMRKESQQVPQIEGLRRKQPEWITGTNQKMAGISKVNGERNKKEMEREEITQQIELKGKGTNQLPDPEDYRDSQVKDTKEGERKLPKVQKEGRKALNGKGKEITGAGKQEGSKESLILWDYEKNNGVVKGMERDKAERDSKDGQVVGREIIGLNQGEEERRGVGPETNGLSGNGPIKQSSWKRRARNNTMQVDWAQEGKIGEKRGVGLISEMGHEGNKKLKGEIRNSQIPIEISTGLVDTMASREQ